MKKEKEGPSTGSWLLDIIIIVAALVLPFMFRRQIKSGTGKFLEKYVYKRPLRKRQPIYSTTGKQ